MDIKKTLLEINRLLNRTQNFTDHKILQKSPSEEDNLLGITKSMDTDEIKKCFEHDIFQKFNIYSDESKLLVFQEINRLRQNKDNQEALMTADLIAVGMGIPEFKDVNVKDVLDNIFKSKDKLFGEDPYQSLSDKRYQSALYTLRQTLQENKDKAEKRKLAIQKFNSLEMKLLKIDSTYHIFNSRIALSNIINTPFHSHPDLDSLQAEIGNLPFRDFNSLTMKGKKRVLRLINKLHQNQNSPESLMLSDIIAVGMKIPGFEEEKITAVLNNIANSINDTPYTGLMEIYYERAQNAINNKQPNPENNITTLLLKHSQQKDKTNHDDPFLEILQQQLPNTFIH